MNVQRPVKRPVKGSDRVRAFRARQKAKGLKLKQFWVPDMNDPAVQARIVRDCERINEADKRDDIYAWLESVNVWPE